MNHYEIALTATEHDPLGVRPPDDGSVSVEQIPAHTLEAITYLFPKKGLQIFTLLLGYAQVKQLALPDHGLIDVAVVALPSIEYFARQHTLSKDTALRYIAMFELLGILSRRRNADQSELHIPLVAWRPGEHILPTLDTCLNSTAREKLRQLATGVKARFLLLYGSPRTWSSLLDDIRATLSDVQEHLMRRSASQSKRFLLHQRVDRLQCRLASSQNTLSQEGDLAALRLLQVSSNIPDKGDLDHVPGGIQATFSTQKGDFQRTKATAMSQKGDLISPLPQQKGDFYATLTSTSDSLPAQKGDSASPDLQQKGDLDHVLGGTQTSFSTQKGDFQREFPALAQQKGDFRAESQTVASRKGDFQEVPSGASFNDNVITHIHKLKDKVVSDNDAPDHTDQEPSYSPAEAAKVGRQLANFLEKTPANTGGFVNKCKQYGPIVIRAAVVDVLIHHAFPQVDPADERGRPKNRARWFHDACKKFGAGTRIPAYVEKWLRTDLSWEEIEQQLERAALCYRRYMVSDHCAAELVRQWLRGELEQQALEDALQAYKPPSREQRYQELPPKVIPTANGGSVVATPDQPPKSWMDEDEAAALAEEVLREARPLGVTSAVPQQKHGVYVVALVWRGAPMIMETPVQWREHLAGVKRALALQERMQQGGSHGALR